MVMFFFKNISMSTISGSSWDLWAVTMSPAVEKTFVTCAAGFSRELWWFCVCFCIVLVLAAVYGIVFLQCLHIVFVLSVTLSPFLISTGKPKSCHTNYLNVAGGSSILISPSRSIMLTSRRDNFSPRREISSRFNLARSCNTRSRHTPSIQGMI